MGAAVSDEGTDCYHGTEGSDDVPEVVVQDECSVCGRGEPEVPLCLFVVTMMDGRTHDDVMCPNCANRCSRLSDVYEVEMEGPVGPMVVRDQQVIDYIRRCL